MALLQRESSPSFAALLELFKVLLGTCSLFRYCDSGGRGTERPILRVEAALQTQGLQFCGRNWLLGCLRKLESPIGLEGHACSTFLHLASRITKPRAPAAAFSLPLRPAQQSCRGWGLSHRPAACGVLPQRLKPGAPAAAAPNSRRGRSHGFELVKPVSATLRNFSVSAHLLKNTRY